MDVETDLLTRVETLELHARDTGAELMVKDMVLKALIATATDRASVLQIFEHALAAREDQFREMGFDKGTPPRIPKGVIEELRKHAERYLLLLRA